MASHTPGSHSQSLAGRICIQVSLAPHPVPRILILLRPLLFPLPCSPAVFLALSRGREHALSLCFPGRNPFSESGGVEMCSFFLSKESFLRTEVLRASLSGHQQPGRAAPKGGGVWGGEHVHPGTTGGWAAQGMPVTSSVTSGARLQGGYCAHLPG